jgi:hypothetical protein
MQQQQIHCTTIKTVKNEHLLTTTVSFVRAAGVLAKGRMFDMPGLTRLYLLKLTSDDNCFDLTGYSSGRHYKPAEVKKVV